MTKRAQNTPKEPQIDYLGSGFADYSGESLDIYGIGDWSEEGERLKGVLAGKPFDKLTGKWVSLNCAICGEFITMAEQGMYPPEALHLCYRHCDAEKRAFMRLVFARENRDR